MIPGDRAEEPVAITNFVEFTHKYERAGNFKPTLWAKGTELFQPSLYTLPQRIRVSAPPTWIARNWPLAVTGLCLSGMAALLVARKINVLRWIRAHKNLTGTISLKRDERSGIFPWQTFEIVGANGTFEVPIPPALAGAITSEGVGYALRLKKALDTAATSEHFSAELLKDGEVTDVITVKPGAEHSLRKPPIRLRYDT
jgi:hypothetical protein